MKFRELAIVGAFEFIPNVFPDDRGRFISPYQEATFVQAVGRPLFAVKQTNSTQSHAGVFRGIHFTRTPPGSAKYVYCSRGRVIDYLIDLRVGSPTFGQRDKVRLDADIGNAVYFCNGLGHAYLSLEDDTRMSYLVSREYVAANELSIRGYDGEFDLGIDLADHTVSERDTNAMTLGEARSRLLLPTYEQSLAADRAFFS